MRMHELPSGARLWLRTGLSRASTHETVDEEKMSSSGKCTSTYQYEEEENVVAPTSSVSAHQYRTGRYTWKSG